MRDTPYLAVDLAILDRNLAEMARSAQARGLALRPHAKTHKCVEIARRQVTLSGGGLTLATVAEAEVFADAGFDDVFIANMGPNYRDFFALYADEVLPRLRG